MAIKDSEASLLINSLADKMEKIEGIKLPEWAKFVKTGVSRERPPQQNNWWFLRSASILRKIYLNPGIGVNKLRRLYGSRKNRGHKPEHRYIASGKIIRTIVQQLEGAGLIETEKKNNKKIGRKISRKGIDLLKDAQKSL